MKVNFLPFQPHSFAFGGFEVQMLSAFDAVQRQGVPVEKQDVWSRNTDFDILHCWGLGFGNYENFVWAKKAGKKLVATVLLHHYETFSKRVKFFLSSKVHSQKFFIEMLQYADAVVVVNEKQAEVCHTLYNVPSFKIHIIPNIVAPVFFNQTNLLPAYSAEQYVLTVGSVCSRKNQINLARACVDEGLKLVIIGKALDGEEDYAQELEKLILSSRNLIWIKGLKEHSQELFQYYRNCTLFALPSFIEQQPISLLEAAVLRKPLLTANSAYGKQKYYSNACLVDPGSVTSIRTGLQSIIHNPTGHISNYDNLLECTQNSVGEAYAKLYAKLIINE